MLPPRTVLAAVDFSETSRVALTFAGRFARHVGAELHVLHALDPLLSAAASARGTDLMRETREELNAFMAAAAPADNGASQQHVVAGAGHHAMLVLGRRTRVDRGGAPGSTAYRVLTITNVPMLVYLPDV